MNLTLLRYFSAVAETRHMTKAAKNLNISQPSLTSSIKRLENEIGVELFDRSTRSMELNEYGRLLLHRAQNIETEWLSALREINELKQLNEKRFNLCIPSSPAKHDLAELLLSEGFSLKFSNLPENWQQVLLEGAIDLVGTLELSTNLRLGRTILSHNEIVIAANPNHPLAMLEQVTVEDINKYPFSSTSTEHSPLACAKNKIASLGLRPNVTFFTNGVQSVIDSVKFSDRLAFMVREHLPKDNNLAILNVENFDIKLPLYLYWRIDKPKPAIDRVINCIKAYYEEKKLPD